LIASVNHRGYIARKWPKNIDLRRLIRSHTDFEVWDVLVHIDVQIPAVVIGKHHYVALRRTTLRTQQGVYTDQNGRAKYRKHMNV
jgi:hypothetical protein